ncbi:MAG TPA: hypothetical protein VE961_10250 [Pyrinomonadaceae bacterium]|nr:hypothetical protein [Pyrinomonadaceae bacterium]
MIPVTENAEIAWAEEPTGPLIAQHLRPGLAVLWRAYLCAQDTGVALWNLSLPTKRLHEAGMTRTDFQWLVDRGFAEYGEETTTGLRRAAQSNGARLSNHIRLVLTAGGAALAEQVFSKTNDASPAALDLTTEASVFPEKQSVAADTKLPDLKPRWDVIRRELSFAGSIIKRFRVPARNQETILSVFEEEGWVEHIHDPLPVTINIDAPTRLHDAINRLNRCQINPLVRFHGDGKGTGVFWELCANQDMAS